MGEFSSGVHSLDKLDTLTCPILCQVVAIMHYVISSHPGLMFLSTTEENWNYWEKNVLQYHNCTIFCIGTVVLYGFVDNQFTFKFGEFLLKLMATDGIYDHNCRQYLLKILPHSVSVTLFIRPLGLLFWSLRTLSFLEIFG